MFQIYIIFLALLFIFKLIYYLIQLISWCNTKKDPMNLYDIHKFKFMVTIGLYQFAVFVCGIVLFIYLNETKEFILEKLSKGYGIWMRTFMTTFSIILLIHASLYVLYFTFYLLFLMLAYYYFKMYDGFSQYDIINTNEF